MRLICSQFEKICQGILNRGFTRVDRLHSACLKSIKALLPRRESERRNHPLSRHVDILTALETRLSLLGMTYVKYIDMGVCCFIPGKVLDEILKILDIVQTTENLPRAHEILQELRDISSMAMEHFEEKIRPRLKAQLSPQKFASDDGDNSADNMPGSSSQLLPISNVPVNRPPTMRNDIMKLQSQARGHNSYLVNFKKDLNDYKLRVAELNKTVIEQEKKIIKQNRLISSQGKKLAAQEKKINDISSKSHEHSMLFEELLGERNSQRKHIKIETKNTANNLPCVKDSDADNDCVSTTLTTRQGKLRPGQKRKSSSKSSAVATSKRKLR
ncbi:F-box only protein 28-like [Tubulanus polymorphus]|uniref:F-box only protein 28-like n=1 Tax=Tubulanus polymorphus TaxID=672921 RepID=UPI003DA465B3